MSLTDGQLGYIAGIVDGEGSLMFGKVKRKTNSRGFVWRVVIDITMTERGAIDFIHGYTKLGFVSGPYVKRSTTRDRKFEKPVWRYTVQFSDVPKFLDLIEPYLLIKKDKCHLLREAQILLTDIYHNKINNKRHDARLEEIYQEMKLLNHRGL